MVTNQKSATHFYEYKVRIEQNRMSLDKMFPQENDLSSRLFYVHHLIFY